MAEKLPPLPPSPAKRLKGPYRPINPHHAEGLMEQRESGLDPGTGKPLNVRDVRRAERYRRSVAGRKVSR